MSSNKLDLKLENYKNSILVFDDVENLSRDKKKQEEYERFLDEILNVGRSFKISIIVISHVLCNFNKTKVILMECDKVVMFPNSGAKFAYVNFMHNYFGMGKRFTRKVLNTKSRWVVLNKSCPLYIVTDSSIQVLQ